MPSAIKDYALIGDCETSALVGRDGSIDWLCLPRFDSDACFASLLGSSENGHWQVSPERKFRVIRRYRPNTLILETEFHSSEGKVTLIDFMPVRERHPRIIRIVKGVRGVVRMHMNLVIRFDYGLTVPWVTRGRADSLLAVAGPHCLILRSTVPVHGEGLRTVSEFIIAAGQTVQFELQYRNSYGRIPPRSNALASLRETEGWWRKWISQCTYTGPSGDALRRSLITLKALTYAPTGGIVAAPTTSLPEQPRGSWNWDYRFCWVRDATFTLLGFIHAGFYEEAQQWTNWLMRSIAGSANQIQVMYGPAGERLLQEWRIPWLSGYRGATPVRIGNAASEQLQLDIFGELADVFHQARVSVGDGRSDFDLLRNLLTYLQKIWRKGDHGIWEIRGQGRHFTHSKVMSWVAFDRAIKTAELYKLDAPMQEWHATRREIYDDVCRRGFNKRLNSFVRTYGSDKVDASLLLIPIVGFLPPLDPRVVGTVRRIEKTLLRGGLVFRFENKKATPGAPRSEGAFLPCSFWLADYYELAGRTREAKQLLNRLLSIRNDLGLLSEEYDVREKQLVGNFPQALTHVALVNTILNLHAKRGPVHQRSSM